MENNNFTLMRFQVNSIQTPTYNAVQALQFSITLQFCNNLFKVATQGYAEDDRIAHPPIYSFEPLW